MSLNVNDRLFDWSNAMDDGVVVQISEFLHRNAALEHVEFEGKLGLIKYRDTDVRPVDMVGIRSESVIKAKGKNLAFESDIGMACFRKLNELLNNYFRNSREARDVLSSRYSQASPCDYVHLVDMDLFYGDNDRMTIAIDQKRSAQKLKSVIVNKVPIENVDIVSGSHLFDYRISCKQEIPVMFKANVHGPNQMCTRSRRKDRLSYTFNNLWSLDLTKVEAFTSHAGYIPASNMKPDKVTYELEVEILNPARILEHLKFARQNHGSESRSSWIKELASSFKETMLQLSFLCMAEANQIPRSCQNIAVDRRDRKRSISSVQSESKRSALESNSEEETSKRPRASLVEETN